jgi:hypothetical protein
MTREVGAMTRDVGDDIRTTETVGEFGDSAG